MCHSKPGIMGRTSFHAKTFDSNPPEVNLSDDIRKPALHIAIPLMRANPRPTVCRRSFGIWTKRRRTSTFQRATTLPRSDSTSRLTHARTDRGGARHCRDRAREPALAYRSGAQVSRASRQERTDEAPQVRDRGRGAMASTEHHRLQVETLSKLAHSRHGPDAAKHMAPAVKLQTLTAVRIGRPRAMPRQRGTAASILRAFGNFYGRRAERTASSVRPRNIDSRSRRQLARWSDSDNLQEVLQIKKLEPGTRPHRSFGLGFCKTLAINTLVCCFLLILLELSYRAWGYFRDCDKICDSAFFTRLDAFNRSAHYGFTGPDPIVGHSLVDGTFKIHEAYWNGATITIREGVRVNPKLESNLAGGAILTVGDSFVFGDQVSDDETWPALLEQRLNRRVVNGGVAAYGTMQAVLRAEQLLKVQDYSLLILSILVGEDPLRDRWVNFDMYRRPAVIRDDGKLRLTTIEESGRVLSLVCAHAWIPGLFFWSHVAKRVFSRIGYDGRCIAKKHPTAATADQIIEFVLERFAALPVAKAILLQYPQYAFSGPALDAARAFDQAREIRDNAKRRGVPVIDTYDALGLEPLDEMYAHHGHFPHHSKGGNGVVADVLVREIAAPAH